MWQEVIIFVAVWFTAQLVDGAIGMAYKIIALSLLTTSGMCPLVASAGIHVAATFTTAASGLAHWRLGNLDPILVRRLILPGMIGGILGALALTIISGAAIRPLVGLYLAALGVFILSKTFNGLKLTRKALRSVEPIGFAGGLFDSFGGGWGAIVTPTLIGAGVPSRTAIGSVNGAEFFVTATIAATLVPAIEVTMMPAVIGLLAGGLVAAPLAALATRYIPGRALTTAVGCVVIVLGVYNLFQPLLERLGL